MASTSGTHLSREFFELIKSIGESRSKQEEDRIIAREILVLKNKLNPWQKQNPAAGKAAKYNTAAENPNFSTKKKTKEFLVRLLYVEMLGHDASFGYIKATELAASTNIVHKRVGYLVSGACLSPEHEFRFMLVNQMQRDLNSQNVLENCAALLAVTRIITPDMVPAVSADVNKLLGHASETVRKKAIITLHRLHQLNSEVVTADDFIEKLRRVLCDRDPAVMGASLNVIESMATVNPQPFKDLTSSLVSILKQIIEHRLPSEFDYHRMPAPWMQMGILRILALLAAGDAQYSSDCYEVVSECLKRADVGANAGYAVVYECIRTITHMYPNPTLLEAAAESISRFISSRSHNLKYLGVTGLASIVESHPQYAAAHQMAVVECLEDPDETLQRRTLELLYKMTNPVNVEFITSKLLSFLEDTTDPFLKQDLTIKIGTIAERYAPSQSWYISSVTKLFELCGDLVSVEVAHNLMTMIAEGDEEEDEEVNMALRQDAVDLYAELLLSSKKKKIPKILVETVAWVLGEYAYLSEEYSLDEILEALCSLARKRGGSLSQRRFLVAAIMKLVAQMGNCPPCAAHVIDEYTKSSDVDLQQRCLEFQNLLTSATDVLGKVLPVDASCEDVDADVNLSFLNGYVMEAKQVRGCMDYNPSAFVDDDDEEEEYLRGAGRRPKTTVNLTPYEKPKDPREYKVDLQRMQQASTTKAAYPSAPYAAQTAAVAPNTSLSGAFAGISQPPARPAIGAPAAPPVISSEPALNVRNVANVWGAKPPTPAPAPVQAAGAPGVPPKFGQQPGSATAVAAQQSAYGGGGYGGWQNNPAPAASTPVAPAPSGPRELTEKEKMAAALFGGIGGAAMPAAGATSVAASRAATRKQRATPAPAPASAPPPAAVIAPAPVSAPVPVQAPVETPAVEVDLLDMMSFGDAPSVSSVPLPPIDVFAPGPVPMSAPVPLVQAPAPAPAAAPIYAMLDPFAAEGLLGGLSDKPLTSFPKASKFQYQGHTLNPSVITTPQFGQFWGSCPATSPSSIVASQTKVPHLDALMSILEECGLHKVETIAATNEGIAAGNLASDGKIVLVHSKMTPQPGGSNKVDVIVKSSDGAMGGALAAFISNQLR